MDGRGIMMDSLDTDARYLKTLKKLQAAKLWHSESEYFSKPVKPVTNRSSGNTIG